MSEEASACAWFQVCPHLTASMVELSSHEFLIVVHPKSLKSIDVGLFGRRGASLKSGM